MFQPVSSKVSLSELERGILKFWLENKCFERSVDRRKGGPSFTMYEGPPTANASPGIHHVLARVFKDLFPRYKTMKGYYAPRRAGWDTHGLPVELEVERELGLKSKPEIESYGVAKFNSRCRQSVLRYVKEWEDLTRRIGFWVDMENAYLSFDNRYIETGWWLIKQLHGKGLVYQGYRVTPHCPRCETSLSSHEVALGYKDDADDPSVYIKFRLTSKLPSEADHDVYRRLHDPSIPTYFLVWTTTPWTLPGNTALAVSPGSEYVVVEHEVDKGGSERLVLAQPLVKNAVRGEHRIVDKVPGKSLVGLEYEPLFEPLEFGVSAERLSRDPLAKVFGTVVRERPEPYRVIAGDFVSMDDGTGIVHIAPAFGEIDYEIGREKNLYLVQTVDLQGKVVGSYPFAGLFVKKADPLILKDLQSRGLLYRSERIKHTYPFCWRCGTPLLYYAKSSWYIKTTAKKDRLLAGNDEINWYPEHIKHGRFGDWLQNNVDWAFSRERYWGTPLPAWRCQSCGHLELAGGKDDIRKLADVGAMKTAGHDLEECLRDLHRPFVDDIVFKCPACQAQSKTGLMRRVPEVLDCWFDSGAMPFAQWHYPFENQDVFEQRFPADFICEAVDQTRGWFYSLHALSILVKDQPSYKNVICLGHILDAKGEKMSKSKGNAVEPWSVLNSSGADALRWYLYTSSPPGNVRRFSAELVDESLRKFLLTLWNTYSFFVTYANIDRFDPAGAEVAWESRPELDRWVLSELNQLVENVTVSLDRYDPTRAGRDIENFVENLSNWYVRRSRRRFWKSENDADKLSAYTTLYHSLVTVAGLLAPFTPFIAEEIYQNLVRSVDKNAPESIHFTDYPVADRKHVDQKLVEDTELVMKVVSLGRSARAKANLKVRQPLSGVAVVVKARPEEEVLRRLEPQVLEELNVKSLSFLQDSELVEFEISPNLPALGPKYGKEMGKIIGALKRADPRKVAVDARAGKTISIDGYSLLPEEVLVNARPRPGYAIGMESGYIVGVTTEIGAELVDEGVARELVHRLQTMRRSAGFDIADYIETWYQGEASLQKVIESFSAYIRQETLSRRLEQGAPPEGAFVESMALDGKEIVLGVRKTGPE